MKRSIPLVLLLLGTACGGLTHVSTVHRNPLGGTLAVRGNQNSWEEATRQMHEHCGGRYAVVDHRRVVVGQQTTTEVTDTGDLVEMRDVYEFQVTYECQPTSTTSGFGYPTSPPGPGIRLNL